MKALCILLAVILGSNANAAVDLSQPIPEVKLITGTVHKNMQIVSYGEKTIMAKWDGGRGTVQVAELPNDVRTAVLAVVQARKPTEKPPQPGPNTPAAKPAPKGTAGSAFDNVRSRGFDVKVYERNSVFVRVAWKTIVVNNSGERMRIRATLLVVDEKNFKLDEEHSDPFLLEPGQSREVSESSMISVGIYNQMKTWKLGLEKP